MKVARRRGFREGDWQETPPLAGRRSRGRGAGSNRYQKLKQAGGIEISREIDEARGKAEEVVTDSCASFRASLRDWRYRKTADGQVAQ